MGTHLKTTWPEMPFSSPYSLNGKSDPYCEFKKVDIQKFNCTPTISGLISAGPWEKIMYDPNVVLLCGKNSVSSD